MKIKDIKSRDLRETTLQKATASSLGRMYVLTDEDKERGLELPVEYLKKELDGSTIEMTICRDGEHEERTTCVHYVNGGIEDVHYGDKAVKMYELLENL